MRGTLAARAAWHATAPGVAQRLLGVAFHRAGEADPVFVSAVFEFLAPIPLVLRCCCRHDVTAAEAAAAAAAAAAAVRVLGAPLLLLLLFESSGRRCCCRRRFDRPLRPGEQAADDETTCAMKPSNPY